MISLKNIRGRLAPSPTGALHLGNIRTFMITWLLVRSRGGELVMRIEDLDHPKVKQGAVEGMIEDLRWLGFDWDEGYGCGPDAESYIQSRRLKHYAAAIELLKKKQLIYPCTCSRKDVESGHSAPHAGETLFYDGRCRERYTSFASAQEALPAGRVPAWRFKVPRAEVVSVPDVFCGEYSQVVSEMSGDFVLARHELGAGYMLAVVVDDSAMGINQVVRGDDLLVATPRQILIYRALGLELPQYIHLPLVVGTDGKRLAKRHGDTRVSAFREAGVTSERIIGLLAASCGWAEAGEELSLFNLLDRFDLNLLPHKPFVWRDELLS